MRRPQTRLYRLASAIATGGCWHGRAQASKRCHSENRHSGAARTGLPVKAADFIARGFAAGPALGHVLTLAEDAWLAADFPLDDKTLAAIADQTAARFAHDHRL